MLQEQEREVRNHPTVRDAIGKMESAGAAEALINSTISTAVGSIRNQPTQVAAGIVARCLLKRLKAFEKEHQPKTWVGKLMKSIFG